MNLALFAAAALAAGAVPAPSPGLTVTASTAPAQGGVVAITVTSERPLPALVLADGDTRFPLERAAGGTVFRGLLGLDLAASTGARHVVFEAPGGATRQPPSPTPDSTTYLSAMVFPRSCKVSVANWSPPGR